MIWMLFLCVCLDHWVDTHPPRHNHHTLVWKGKWSNFSWRLGSLVTENCLCVFVGWDWKQPRPHRYIPSLRHSYHEPGQRQPVPPLVQQPQRPGGGETRPWRERQRQNTQVSTKHDRLEGLSSERKSLEELWFRYNMTWALKFEDHHWNNVYVFFVFCFIFRCPTLLVVGDNSPVVEAVVECNAKLNPTKSTLLKVTEWLKKKNQIKNKFPAAIIYIVCI